MNLDINQAELSHCDMLSQIAFDSKAVWGYSPEFMESCREEITVSEKKITDDRFQHYFASDGARPIGFYSLEKINDVTVELEALFVSPDFIGEGVGSLLFAHAAQTAELKGFAEMIVVSDPNASAFYLRQGCDLVGERESGSVAGRHLPLLRFKLRETK